MSTDNRPTEAELADAVMRLVDEFDAAYAALGRAMGVLRERKKQGNSLPAGPLFPFVGDAVYDRLSNIRASLYETQKMVAPQYLNACRALAKEQS